MIDRNAVLRVQSQLTDRDHILLGWLADHGVLTSFQIAHALFPSVDFAQKRLRKLVALGVLARFRPNKPDGGSWPYHYVLDQLGVDVVAAQRDEDELPRRDHARKRRWYLTNRTNLPHLLATNQFFIELAGYARTHPDTRLQRWWSAGRCQKPAAFYQDGDAVQVLAHRAVVRPDGHGIWTDEQDTVPFFAEIDLSTEPLGTLVDKINGYLALADVTRRIWPVLFWLESPAREANLHEALTRAGMRYPVATTVRGDPALAGRSPAEQVWWLHGHAGGLLWLADLVDTVVDLRAKAA